MAAIKNQNNLTPQEEVFAREVAYMMLGTDLSRLGIDVRCEMYLYLAYKKAYPRTKASVPSLQSMACRLYKKVKIRSRIDDLTKQFEQAIIDATADSVAQKINRLLNLTTADFFIIDQETGTTRMRKEYELSTDAWWLVKRMYKYGYEKMTITDIVDALAKFKGWYKPQETVTTINTATANAGDGDEIVLMFGGKKFGNEDKD